MSGFVQSRKLMPEWLVSFMQEQKIEVWGAAEVYDKGDLYVQLAQLYMDAEEWAKAVKALNSAIKKGNLSSPGITYLLLGMSKMSLRQYSGAITAFNKAATYKRTQNSAKKWISIAKTKMKESRS